MIERGSKDWEIFLEKLQKSKNKSNRDVICLVCWEVLKYESNLKHKQALPDHTGSILTSKEFCHEMKFVSVARALGKSKVVNNHEYFENPYLTQLEREQAEEEELKSNSQSKKDGEGRIQTATILGSEGTDHQEENTLDLIKENEEVTIKTIHNQVKELRATVDRLEKELRGLKENKYIQHSEVDETCKVKSMSSQQYIQNFKFISDTNTAENSPCTNQFDFSLMEASQTASNRQVTLGKRKRMEEGHPPSLIFTPLQQSIQETQKKQHAQVNPSQSVNEHSFANIQKGESSQKMEAKGFRPLIVSQNKYESEKPSDQITQDQAKKVKDNKTLMPQLNLQNGQEQRNKMSFGQLLMMSEEQKRLQTKAFLSTLLYLGQDLNKRQRF